MEEIMQYPSLPFWSLLWYLWTCASTKDEVFALVNPWDSSLWRLARDYCWELTQRLHISSWNIHWTAIWDVYCNFDMKNLVQRNAGFCCACVLQYSLESSKATALLYFKTFYSPRQFPALHHIESIYTELEVSDYVGGYKAWNHLSCLPQIFSSLRKMACFLSQCKVKFCLSQRGWGVFVSCKNNI